MAKLSLRTDAVPAQARLVGFAVLLVVAVLMAIMFSAGRTTQSIASGGDSRTDYRLQALESDVRAIKAALTIDADEPIDLTDIQNDIGRMTDTTRRLEGALADLRAQMALEAAHAASGGSPRAASPRASSALPPAPAANVPGEVDAEPAASLIDRSITQGDLKVEIPAIRRFDGYIEVDVEITSLEGDGQINFPCPGTGGTTVTLLNGDVLQSGELRYAGQRQSHGVVFVAVHAHVPTKCTVALHGNLQGPTVARIVKIKLQAPGGGNRSAMFTFRDLPIP